MTDTPSDQRSPAPAKELKTALKAFKKRLNLMRLDAASAWGKNPLSGGRGSGIIAITPPDQYPQSVWDELVRQGKLKRMGDGTYGLAEE